MLGLVCYRDAGERDGQRGFGGAVFRAVYVERGGGLRAYLSAKRAARRLKRQRVQRAVFPLGYPYSDVFARAGILPPEELPLRRAKAAEIACRAMEELGLSPSSARVALLASRAYAAEEAAISLARRVRYLTLCFPGDERLARALRWDCGVSAYLARRDETLRADLAVSFDAGAPPCACPVLSLADETLAVSYGARLPPGSAAWDRRQLICALFAAGALRAEDIAVEAVRRRP